MDEQGIKHYTSEHTASSHDIKIMIRMKYQVQNHELLVHEQDQDVQYMCISPQGITDNKVKDSAPLATEHLELLQIMYGTICHSPSALQLL